MCESILVFLCHATRIKELPAHSQSLRNDVRHYGNFPDEENEKLDQNLVKTTKGDHFERDVNANVIRIILKHFIDHNFTTYEDFLRTFFLIIKKISTSFMEIKMSSELKSLCVGSVASSKRSNSSKKIL